MEEGGSCLATAFVPCEWKTVVIYPLLKKGDPEDVNYCPVSLTLVVCKVFERIFKRVIFSFLSEYNATKGCQHGFLPRRPCLFNLLLLEGTVIRLVGDSNTADVVYLDFTKAFDLVNHRLLSAKLESFGLCKKAFPF